MGNFNKPPRQLLCGSPWSTFQQFAFPHRNNFGHLSCIPTLEPKPIVRFILKPRIQYPSDLGAALTFIFHKPSRLLKYPSLNVCHFYNLPRALQQRYHYHRSNFKQTSADLLKLR